MSKIYRAIDDSQLTKVQFQDLDEIEASEDGDIFQAEQDYCWEEKQDQKEPKIKEQEAVNSSSRKESELQPEPIDREAIKNEAYDQGYQDGKDKAVTEFNSTVRALEKALKEIDQLREKIFKNSREEMVELVMKIAEQVIYTEICIDKNVIVKIVEKAIQAAVSDDKYHIRVSPEDKQVLDQNKPLFLASVDRLEDIVFDADGSISPGGCLVESEVGEVDATLEFRLEEIKQHLRQVVAQDDGTVAKQHSRSETN